MAIASINIASATGTNWLKEAQSSIAASESPGGLLGALQDARSDPSSITSFLAKSQNNMNNLMQIQQSNQASASALASQMSAAAYQKLRDERIQLAQKLNPQQTNYTPPAGLDSVIYFEDGTTIDTANNIMTLASGKQVDTITGQDYHAPGSIVNMANGAYLDTQNNVFTMADGTKIDTVTGLAITV
jgi:hypothetical protein